MAAKNVKMECDGKNLVITVDLTQSLGDSKSGKSVLIASTGGNIAVPNAEGVKIGLNIYKNK